MKRRSDIDLAIEGVRIKVGTGKKSRKPAHREGFKEVWVVVPNEETVRGTRILCLSGTLFEDEGKVKVPRSEGREDSGELAKASMNYVKKSMIAYLDGKKNLNWILGMIRSFGLRGELLMRVFEELESYGRKDRWERALEACRKKEML